MVKKGYKQTDEHINKRMKHLEGKRDWAKGLTKETDERIKKRSISMKKYANTSEGKKNLSNAAKESNKLWNNPTVRKNRIEGIKKSYTPELRKQRSESTKTQMQDPEQIQIRHENCGLTWDEMTEEQRQNRRINDEKLCTSITLARREAIRLAENKCARCGQTKSRMAVHHIDGYIFNNEQENLVVLCNSCHSVVHKAMSKDSSRFFGQATVANKLGEALKHLGIDPNHPDTQETPQRIARVWAEFTEGTTKESQERITYVLGRKFPTEYSGIVLLTSIDANSMCPHHFLPVKMKVDFAYIPNKYAIGLSKITEFIMLLSKQPILQEHLAKIIVDKFNDEVKPKGVFILISGEHSCMTIRDTRQTQTKTITSEVRGVFETDIKARQEVLSLISMHKED